jgi:hypothetical protein
MNSHSASNFAFISSLTRNAQNLEPLNWRTSLIDSNLPIWIAEKNAPKLADLESDQLVISELSDAIKNSERVFCVFSERHGQLDYGTAVHFGPRMAEFRAATQCSFLELELVLAQIFKKPIWVFCEQGFLPGPRQRKVLELLKVSLPSAQFNVLENLDEQLPKTIAQLYAQVSAGKSIEATGNAQHTLLLQSLSRLRRPNEVVIEDAPHYLAEPDPILDSKPDLDLVHTLLSQSREIVRLDDRLSTLWLARRELGAWAVTTNSIPKDPNVRKALTDTLALWAGAAAWSGLNGRTPLGQIEALSELGVMDTDAGGEHIGGLASAYYSEALLMPWRERAQLLHAALAHSYRAERLQPGNAPNIQSIRASIFLRQGKLFASRTLYRKVLDYKEIHASADAIGEARVEWAFAIAITGNPWRAAREADLGLAGMVENNFKIRALKKRGRIAQLCGKFGLAKIFFNEASRLAEKFRAGGQV